MIPSIAVSARAIPAPRFSRVIEVDFLRGLVLAMIVVDHIGGSLISHVTLHAFALCDATEVFVFLGGFAAASAYSALAELHGEAAARLRFVRRAAEIYRAFLVTTVLMLALSAVLAHCRVESPHLALCDLHALRIAPLSELAHVLMFQRQPYLASVLPMYVWFALLIPALVPFARARPWLLLVLATAVWAASDGLGAALLGAASRKWSFNPFAWQLLFVYGVLVRCQPFHVHVAGRRVGLVLTVLAAVAVCACVYYKLWSGLPLPEGEFKRDLAWPRVVNFLALAWLTAECSRLGWIKRVAGLLRPIVVVGQRGLVCFVAGTGISLTLDALLRGVAGGAHLLQAGAGFAADACALGLLVGVAVVDTRIARLRRAKAG